MKALILAGGTGTRLRPFTHAMPKQLMPVAGRPVLSYCLECVREIGVDEVGIVVGGQADQIRAAIGDGSRAGVRVTYIEQPSPLGLAHCVRVAAGFLGDEDFVMYLGDNILFDGLAPAAELFRARRPSAAVLVGKVDDPRDYGVAELNGDGRVTALTEKPESPRSDLALIGVYFFTPAIHDAVRRVRPSRRGELEITDAIGLLVAEGHDVLGEEYSGYWKDTGKIDDLLDCNRFVLDGLRAGARGRADAASTLTGEVIVAEDATVIGSELTGPVIVGPGSVVRDSRIGPHTSIGAGCVITSAGIRGSIVLDHATVTGVTGIEDSLIGRGAEVTAGRRRHRLLIGDDTRIEVAA
ncbi:glucose-1-phosphate thymidylyltransferase [Actinoallomurus spadix]|uniref:Glucose-1-phosphate thymidylyltransferase n=1 Tax=Actinoallomurus spadix TaxID=79912 RepID=A0ABN0W156_9ACTN|nr:glucose-1-phosphate thymidylyltransferase [Actinoallomurus spadix]MCO5985359.1 glucose-1-phosphate thymidylyltransferase [Actinoallomurus spadix]